MSTKTPIHVNELRPGDLLLHSSTGEISKLIMWASDSDYSHVGMVFAPGRIAEARSAGVLFDSSLAERVAGIGTHFHFIDVLRPQSPDPLPPKVLQALQDSALSLKDARFALNQMLELGLICALRSKFPGGTLAQRIVGKILDRLVHEDPTRLVCSEFLYLAFRDARTEPPKLLAPRIERKNHADRPWPADLNLGKLLKEYLDANKHGTAAALEEIVDAASGMVDTVALASQDPVDVGALSTLVRMARTEAKSPLFLGKDASVSPNPELILPQDFVDSPSFRWMGTLVS
jgi:hypothetical protein